MVPTTTTLTVPWSGLHLKQKYRGNIFLFSPSFHYNTTRCISKERPNTLDLGAALHEEDALTSSEQSFQLLFGEDTDGVGRVAVKCRVRHRVCLLQTVKSFIGGMKGVKLDSVLVVLFCVEVQPVFRSFSHFLPPPPALDFWICSKIGPSRAAHIFLALNSPKFPLIYNCLFS